MTQFPVAHPRATARSRVFAIINNPDLIAVVIVALLGLLRNSGHHDSLSRRGLRPVSSILANEPLKASYNGQKPFLERRATRRFRRYPAVHPLCPIVSGLH